MADKRLVENVWDMVYKHISDMLDHPNEYDIYPTSKCYKELSHAIADWIEGCVNLDCKRNWEDEPQGALYGFKKAIDEMKKNLYGE